jgi:acyl carrier protein
MGESRGSEKRLLARLFGSKPPVPDEAPTRPAIQAWMVNRLAKQLEVDPAEIDVREPFQSYGLGSRTALSISGELERWLRRRLSPTLLWDYPTIEQLAGHLAEGGEGADPASPGANGSVSAPAAGAESEG